jgi:hypothetical protein
VSRFAYAEHDPRDDYEDPEVSELRAEARHQRAMQRPCCECSGTRAHHVPGCPEDNSLEDDDE